MLPTNAYDIAPTTRLDRATALRGGFASFMRSMAWRIPTASRRASASPPRGRPCSTTSRCTQKHSDRLECADGAARRSAQRDAEDQLGSHTGACGSAAADSVDEQLRRLVYQIDRGSSRRSGTSSLAPPRAPPPLPSSPPPPPLPPPPPPHRRHHRQRRRRRRRSAAAGSAVAAATAAALDDADAPPRGDAGDGLARARCGRGALPANTGPRRPQRFRAPRRQPRWSHEKGRGRGRRSEERAPLSTSERAEPDDDEAARCWTCAPLARRLERAHRDDALRRRRLHDRVLRRDARRHRPAAARRRRPRVPTIPEGSTEISLALMATTSVPHNLLLVVVGRRPRGASARRGRRLDGGRRPTASAISTSAPSAAGPAASAGHSASSTCGQTSMDALERVEERRGGACRRAARSAGRRCLPTSPRARVLVAPLPSLLQVRPGANGGRASASRA